MLAWNECLGVRPICVGEDSRGIIRKSILVAIGGDSQAAAGTVQLCKGLLPVGCEVAVRTMKEILHDSETQAVLMVDATNSFNILNRRS